MDEKLFIPIILGTVRKGRYSEHAARFVLEKLGEREEVETELIDIRDLPFDLSDEGEDQKDREFAKKMERADGYVIVTPEYNRSFPGSLKHVLDTNYSEYRYKPVGLCGVSKGDFGGARAIVALLPSVKMYGMYPIRPELNFFRVQELFDESGQVKDRELLGRVEKQLPSFFDELIKLAYPLKEFRKQG
jgi:NAD(P)H-dependent FMN reductase